MWLKALILLLCSAGLASAHPRGGVALPGSPGSSGFLPTCQSTFSVQNEILHSQTFTTSPWATAAAVVAAPTVTANSTTAPDGTSTASTLALPAVVGSNAQSVLYQPISLFASYKTTFDIYIRGAVGGEHVWLSLSTTGDSSNFVRTAVVATTGWTRYSLTFAPGTAATSGSLTVYPEIGVDLRDGSQTTQSAQTVYIWGAQVTNLETSVPYIPTTTVAVTARETVNCPPGVGFRDFAALTAINGTTPTFAPTGGAYGAGGVSIPRISEAAKVGSTYFMPTACTPTGFTWTGICEWTGTTWAGAADIVTGEPIIAHAGSTWEDNWLLHPEVSPACSIGTWCVYYSGLNAARNQGAIGVAYSNDVGVPTHWTKYGSNPVIADNAVANASSPNVVSVIQIGSTLYMYASGKCGGVCGATPNILYWTSPASDGLTWTFGGTALQPAISGDWDAAADSVIDPHVSKNSHGFYEMAYTALGSVSCVFQAGAVCQEIGYAVSADGVTWYKYQAAPMIAPGGSAYPGANAYVGDAHFFQDGTNFYVGYDTAPLSADTSSGFIASMTDH